MSSETKKPADSHGKQIRIGIGGWTYAQWRDNFYPADLPQARELEYASRQVTAIEINGTFYGTQKPSTFAKWKMATPDDFLFSLEAPRYATNRRTLADAGDSIERFIDSGIAELGDKLGPLLWQLPPSKSFDSDDLAAFFELLPAAIDGRDLRHVLEVRHPSFMTRDYLQLARKYAIATVFTDSGDYPSFADFSGDFVYARLMRSNAKLKTGYSPKALDGWIENARSWTSGAAPQALPYIAAPTSGSARDVFIFFIDGAKERAPAAACALLERLRERHEPGKK
jgi:uncharacterized protein YecE (DUF72 family)